MSRNPCWPGFLCLLVSLTASAADPVGPDLDRSGRPAATTDPLDVTISSESTALSWREREQLLGDLGGLRTWLADRGMGLEIVSLDEGFANPDNQRSASETGHYHGLTDVVFSLDSEAAGWWSGGVFVVDLQNVRGGDISDTVGDLQGISNIVGPPGTRFVEYFLEQNFGDGRWTLKVGKQDANADFVVSDGGGEFVNSSFGIVPTVPLPTFPAPALGAMAAWTASDAIRLKAGIWDGAPALGSGCSLAMVDGSQGSVGALGVEIRPFGGRVLDGTYRVGVWRHSEVEIAASAKAASEPLTGPAEGVYFTVDQGLWEKGDRRLAAFAQGGWGEADRSAFSRYFGGGLTLHAPFPGRPADVVGLAVATAEIGGLERPTADCPAETVVELFYKAPLTGWLTLNPDLQWVRRPGGSDGTAFVAGLRFATVF